MSLVDLGREVMCGALSSASPFLTLFAPAWRMSGLGSTPFVALKFDLFSISLENQTMRVIDCSPSW
jgi:hypothetical protein